MADNVNRKSSMYGVTRQDLRAFLRHRRWVLLTHTVQHFAPQIKPEMAARFFHREWRNGNRQALPNGPLPEIPEEIKVAKGQLAIVKNVLAGLRVDGVLLEYQETVPGDYVERMWIRRCDWYCRSCGLHITEGVPGDVKTHLCADCAEIDPAEEGTQGWPSEPSK